jgi:peptidyl-dipeptidase Dcp
MIKVGLLLGSIQARSAFRLNASPLSHIYLYSYRKMSASAELSSNPLVQDWSKQPHGLPPFHEIKTSHFPNAFTLAMDEHKKDLVRIATSSEDPTFDNTMRPYDSAGKLLCQVAQTFSNLCASNSSAELQAVEAQMAGPLAAHQTAAYFTPGLFDRVHALFEKRHDQGLENDALLLIERIHLDFVRAGALFDEKQKVRYSEIVERLAVLTTQFTQNVTLDESDVFVPLAEGDLEVLP